MAVETLLKTPVSRSKSSKGSRVSKASDKRSWMASMSRRSVSRVHSSFSLHTRVAHVLAEDRRDALDPNSRVCTTWSQLLLLLILTETFVLPYLLVFDPVAMENVSLLFVLVASCEGLFALDLFVQAHTGYYWDGNLIRDKQDTRRRYLCSRQFALDLVAILPGQALVLVCPGIVLKTMFLKLARWSRLPKLLLLLDELYAKNFVVLKLLKVLVSTLYVAHILACVRHSFGYDESGRNLWLPQTPRPSESLLRDYLAALFWSVGIMTGYFEGEIPRHISEFLFTILVALCGFSMFVTMCATIFVISKCQSGNTEAVEARINQLVHVLSFHRVPEYQQMKAIEYLQRYYTDAESTDRDTAKILCPSIANDIQVELLKSTIARVPIFDGCSDRFIVAITSLLEMIAVPAQTTLISPETYGHAMYVVGSGVLAILVQSVSVQEIRKGSCFGELFVFSSSIPCRATVISATYAILYKLSRFHCERVLQGYPDCAGVIAGHVNYMLRKANSSKDNNTSEASSSTSSTPAGSSRALKSRRSSRASRVITETSNLVKSLSRRRSSVRPWLAKKSFINPTELDIPRSKGAHMYTGSYLREITAELMPSLTSETPTGSSTPFTRTARLPHQRGPAISYVHNHQGMWRLVLFRRCIDHQSRTRMWWLLLLLSNMFYCWLMIPVQITFPLWQRPTLMAQTTDTISNAGLFVDIILNLNLSYTADSDKIMDPIVTAQRYVKGELFFDLLCAFPYEYLYMERYPLMRLPRLLRVWRLEKYLKEIACFIYLGSRRQLFLLGLLFFIICHVVTCIHFGVSYIEGFSPNDKKAWISPASLCLRRLNATHLDNCNGTIFDESVNRVKLDAITAMEYFRSHYVAVGVFTSPGNSVEPTGSLQLIVALLFMLGGFLISAIIVDNVQKRFTASAFEQKEFFETSSRIRRFLRRQDVPILIHHRVKSFLDYWWSAHRGAVISELLADLPRSIRLELLQSICTPILQTLRQLQGLHSASQSLDEILVENAKFVLYGQSETIYRHGDYATGIYFLLEGEISIVKMGGTPCELPKGGFFGAAALVQQERGEGYTEHVSATSGCILLFVSRDQLQAMETIFPGFNAELLSYGQRLLSKKRSDRSISTFQDGTPDVQARQRAMNELIRRPKFTDLIHDPDSTLALLWETWMFVVMTVQWVLITFQMCFPLGDEHKTADGLMLFMETAFVLDLFVRSRLGFYEYGNKVMELQRIKQRYLKSGTFAMDIVALIPLYVINWEVPVRYRWNLINVNKLLRLFKTPRQLQALETRYLKLTTELHLFKLLYYTFMLSHFLACLWFNFASKAAVPNVSSTVTAFGNDAWLPGKNLEKSSLMLQYMASLYWSFGLMSSSGNSAFPQTTFQSIFSVITMASGFFLFAYVVGNFTDIIDLISSEARDFNAKMGAVRQMLDHFAMADELQERVKTFLLFKRHHTITEEHVLVHCLPPSLLTDIRLVYMKPMIDKVEFLTGMESSITRMLVSQFQQVLVSRGEFVFKLGDSGSDMFFVFTGVLHVLLPSRVANPTKTTFKIVAEILAGRMEVVDGALNHAGPQEDDIIAGMKHKSVKDELKKVNEVSGGSYFGENGLFTNKKRDAYIQAHTSCILYRLSRESLELVFDRYPKWKQKVLRIANIHREQARLIHLSRKEQRLGLTAAASMLSRSDIMNWHAESLKELQHHTHLQRINDRSSPSLVYRTIIKTLSRLYDYALHGVDVQSQCHLFWLRFVVSCTAYVAILIPYELTMDPMDRVTTVTTLAKLCELLCEIVFALDVWFSWHIRESPDAMELYDENLRSSYRKEPLYWDLIAAIPIYDMLSLFKCSPWFKMLRCVKILNMKRYLDELNRRGVASEIMRFSHVSILYLLVIYWSACAYLAVATKVGFASDWEDWLPSQELQLEDPLNPSSKRLALRLLRGLSFAVTTIVKKTYIPTPTTALVFLFHIVMSFIGLLVMSFVIGELASIFISYIDLEVGFRKNCIAVELYLRRLRVSEQLKARTAAFMTSLWSSHAGVNYEELLAEMPCDIRAACVLHVSKKPLDWFVMKVATPLCWEGDECIDALTLSLAKRLRFESYPRDENVVAEGSVVRAMYFVIKGHLKMESRSLIHRPLGLRDGSYFGERGLLACAISAYNVRTVRACDLLSLSSEAFAQVLNKYPFSRLALKLCDAAYKLMKTQNIASCSKPDMEDHWGAALLSLLQSIRDQRLEAFAVSDRAAIFTDADASFTASAVVLNGDLTALATVWSPERPATFDASGASTRIKESGDQGMQPSDDTPAKRPEFMTSPTVTAEWGELPAHIDEMFEALDTAQCCFEAFAPLLHIVLATDPLDWKASFGASFSAKIVPEASIPAKEVQLRPTE